MDGGGGGGCLQSKWGRYSWGSGGGTLSKQVREIQLGSGRGGGGGAYEGSEVDTVGGPGGKGWGVGWGVREWRLQRKWGRYSCVRVQELCESRGGRPGLPVPTSLMVSVDVKQHWTMLRHWSQFVTNMSTDIRGHEALHHHQQLGVEGVGWLGGGGGRGGGSGGTLTKEMKESGIQLGVGGGGGGGGGALTNEVRERIGYSWGSGKGGCWALTKEVWEGVGYRWGSGGRGVGNKKKKGVSKPEGVL